MFYGSLIKFRDEQLENYQGPPLEYSSSDYHHISRPVAKSLPRRMSSAQVQNLGRRRAQFSIATSGVSSREGSYKEPRSARTVESYDPYRSSRTPVCDPRVEYASVTVHRRPSGATRDHSAGARHRAVSRVQTDEISSSPPPSHVGREANPSKRISAISFQSRSSIASSRRGFTPVPSRRSASYQRNVSFRHIRKRSGTSTSFRPQVSHTQSQYSIGPEFSDRVTPRPTMSRMLSPDRYSSPSLPTPPQPVRQRNVSARAANEVKSKKPRVSSNYWKDDARKVSSELGQICEEAFNRSAVSPEKSPVSRRSTVPTAPLVPSLEKAKRPDADGTSTIRPLPEPPAESTGSYATRELLETRRRLIEHSTKANSEGLPAYLTDVISHLDRLIERNPFDSDRGRRAISDPMPKISLGSEQLPAISEEQRLQTPTKDREGHLESRNGPINNSQRVTSDPTARSGPSFSRTDEKSTIRIVPQTPLPPLPMEIKPLTIRKKSSAITNTAPLGDSSSLDLLGSSASSPHEENKTINHSSANSRRGASGGYDTRFPTGGLDTIVEYPSPKRSDTMNSGENKKWSWFKHRSQVSEDRPVSPTKETTQPSRPASALGLLTDMMGGSRPVEDEQDRPVPKRTSFEKGKGGFLKLFGKKKQRRRLSHEVATGGEFPFPLLSGSQRSFESP